jgi:hypothetical protein
MSIIKLPIRYEGSQGENTLCALFDSVATISCIHADRVESVEKPVKLRHPKEVATASELYAFYLEKQSIHEKANYE